jgi:signal transduction histidine kinase/AmiR/NasT family two-component response regulator
VFLPLFVYFSSFQWTVYPLGKGPTQVNLEGSGITIEDGRMAMLNVGRELKIEEIDKSNLRGVEILRYVPASVCVFDIDGNIVHQNPEALSVFGKPARESKIDVKKDEEPQTSGETIEMKKEVKQESHFRNRFVDQELGDRVFEEVAVKGNDFSVEALQHTKSGLIWSAIKVRRAQDPVTQKPIILYCTRDITDVIEAKKLADQASLQKSEFLAVMAHEIRTPLHQVIGCIELLGETTLNQEQSGFVNLMQNSAFSLMAVINDLLDFTKIEAGKMELESIPFEARGVCDGALATMEGKAAEKGLILESSVSAHIPLKVVGDPNRLRQILLNLVNNAVKFTSQGTITLSVSKAETDEKGRSILRFAVSDTGMGISTDHQKHIFVKYQQADPSVARHYGGSGLGLSICTSLVRLMGGSIGVESEVGKGSTFWFEAPFEKPENLKLKGEGKADSEDTVCGLSVLVAEDNKVNQKVVSAMLRRLGHKVTIAANGQIALDLLEQGDFDVILMDVQMPVLDGIEATKEIRRRGWTRPVIGLTASFQWSELGFYQEIGMDDCLGKPVMLKDLRSAIFQALKPRVEICQNMQTEGATSICA